MAGSSFGARNLAGARGVLGAGRAIARPEWCRLSEARCTAGEFGGGQVVLAKASTVPPGRMVPPIGGTVSAGGRGGWCAAGPFGSAGCLGRPFGRPVSGRPKARPAWCRAERCCPDMVPPIGGTVCGAADWRHGSLAARYVVPPIGGTVPWRHGMWCRRLAARHAAAGSDGGHEPPGNRPAVKAGGSCRPANRPDGFTAGQAMAWPGHAPPPGIPGGGRRWPPAAIAAGGTVCGARRSPGTSRGGAVPARQPPGRWLVRPERCRLIRCRRLTARFFGGTVYGRAGHGPPPGIPGGGVSGGMHGEGVWRGS